MENSEFEKAMVFNIVDLLNYQPDSVEVRSIFKKTTGNIKALALDSDQMMAREILPFDNFVQVIDGKAQIVIDEKSHLLVRGQSIIIPAHSRNSIKAVMRLKIISTIIKSGYEEISL